MLNPLAFSFVYSFVCLKILLKILNPPLLASRYYEGPPVMAPPMYMYTAAPPRSQPGFLEACLATLCCCCLLDCCCWDPFLCI
ncbi:protein CYSTEINE-RICH TRANSMEMBRANE MODULE 11-like [Lycium barbarum]|uniref:protein CYSTEINE-RICH TRANSMEMBRANE MODULE 11-like n=1 Tax=Lycium barbarum TaxID=112863 RepID=UPI00293F2071|nr:protein CYSTEINE-RICH TRANSMEMBRANE MODULE 11-like [Lycium barbarum]